MSETPQLSSNFISSHDDPPLKNRAGFGIWALGSISLGMFSLLSLLGPALWICGGLGFLGCTLIMIHLNHHQTSSGVRFMGAGGLCLSLLIISYAPTQYYLQQKAIAQQAALFGNDWIRNILAGKPYNALAALQHPETRLATDQLKSFYLKTSEGRQEMEQFEKKRLIKSLLLLNGRARSQFYDTETIRFQGSSQIITSLFSISYLETPLKRKTFFVRLVLKRSPTAIGEEHWSIVRYRGGVRPHKGTYSKRASPTSAS